MVLFGRNPPAAESADCRHWFTLAEAWERSEPISGVFGATKPRTSTPVLPAEATSHGASRGASGSAGAGSRGTCSDWVNIATYPTQGGSHTPEPTRITTTNAFARYFKADELQNDDRGWAYNLAIFRLVYLGVVVLPFGLEAVRWTAHRMPQLPRDAWKPISFYAYLPFDLIANAPLGHALAIVNVALVALGLLGVYTRWTLGLAAITSMYVLGLMQNQGKVDHFHHIVWFMALLAVGPSGRVLSFDSIRAAIRGADSGIVGLPPPKGTALLTLRYIWVLFGLAYLTPGLSKLEAAVSDGWATTHNLVSILWLKWLELYLYEPAFQLPPRIDALPFPFLTLGGLGVILFETAFILLVLLRPARPLLALAGVGFHLGNQLFLHISFTSLMVAYVSLGDWTAMGRGLYRWFKRRELVVLYDGGCRLCRRTVALLKAADLFDQLVPVAGFSQDPGRGRYAVVTDEMLARDLHVVDGERVAHGYDAYVWIGGRIPLLWPLAWLMRLPPASRIGRMLYRNVADSRHCALPESRPALSKGVGNDVRPIRYLGTLLVVSQISISMFQFTTEHLAKHLRTDNPIRVGMLGIAWRLPAWPFDGYPTFADLPRSGLEVWEARALLSDGREVRLGARSYARAFGHPAKGREAADGARREKNPDRHRDRSLGLVKALWPHEGADVRSRATEIRVYHVRYGLDPSHRQPRDERLMHTFPVGLVSIPG